MAIRVYLIAIWSIFIGITNNLSLKTSSTMRKLIAFATFMLLCVATFAQQTLWGVAPVVSPEIHENNTVTFRLKAPKAV